MGGGEAALGNFGIDARGGRGRMTERVLNNGEVAAGFEQVGGEPMAEFVRRIAQVNVGAVRELDKDALNLARGESWSAAVCATGMGTEDGEFGKRASLFAVVTEFEIGLEGSPCGF